jgi:hypothetical protein
MFIRKVRHAVGVVAVTAALGLCSTAASAYIGCTEQVTNVIMHSDGAVYFTTNQTCSNGWCQLAWTADAAIKGYAMLLSAQAQGTPLTFAWDNLASCTSVNTVYASPDFMMLAGS